MNHDKKYDSFGRPIKPKKNKNELIIILGIISLIYIFLPILLNYQQVSFNLIDLKYLFYENSAIIAIIFVLFINIYIRKENFQSIINDLNKAYENNKQDGESQKKIEKLEEEFYEENKYLDK